MAPLNGVEKVLAEVVVVALVAIGKHHNVSIFIILTLSLRLLVSIGPNKLGLRLILLSLPLVMADLVSSALHLTLYPLVFLLFLIVALIYHSVGGYGSA